MKTSKLSLLLLVACTGLPTNAATFTDVNSPPWPWPIGAAQRPGAYWWIPGSAFSPADIDFNLTQFRDAGFGFAHIVPIYGARGAEDRYITFLTPRWMEMLDYSARRGRELGLFVDMTTGSGWCFGGPGLPANAIDAKAKYDAGTNTVSLTPGKKVKRAGPGGEGPMLDPYSPRAMAVYLERFSKAFDGAGLALPRAQYHDSFEYQGDWTADLLPEFKARRGYDLAPHLPVFFGTQAPADPEQRARLKCDYRETLAELHREFIGQWSQWSRARGMITRNQAHGSPSNLLDVYAAADIPETEMFGAPEFAVPGFRRDPSMVREGDSDRRIRMMAASAAHVAHAAGKQLVASESFTWMREHWHGTLAQMKLQLDLFFLAGVNQMLFHGSCYSPKDAPWPGWFFYASTQMNWRNSVWHDVRFLNEYIARCQSVLQAGSPANDVLVYWPIHDLWMNAEGMTIPLTVHRREWMSEQRIGEVANALLAKGYALDFISDRMLDSLQVRDGRLVAPGGAYSALVVPAAKYMPVPTLRRLVELRDAGAVVIFERSIPADVPGLADLEPRRAEAATLRHRLQQSSTIVAADAVSGLDQAGIAREPMVDAGLQFIRRTVDGAHWYFIANHTAKDFDGWLPLGVPFAAATAYDPMTAVSGRLALRPPTEGGRNAAVYLQLAAGQSMIVQVEERAEKERMSPREGRAVTPLAVKAGAERSPRPTSDWRYYDRAGRPTKLTGEWSVEFIDGGPALPAPFQTKQLESWTKSADVKAEAFAGTARYTLRFGAPPLEADAWLLDLGDVRDSARVRLNGQPIGALLALPFRISVGEHLRRGAQNLLEIEVTNVAANRIRDLERRKVPWKIMRDANIVNVNYKNFEPDQWPIEDSGLLGPVTLTPLKAKRVP